MDRRQFLAVLGGGGAFAFAGPAAAAETATVVRYPDRRSGVVFVSLGKKRLYLTRGDGTALSWPVAVGKPGQSWKGATQIVSKHVSPAWQAPASIRGGRGLGPVIPGGSPENPMGARALMLEKEEIAIHGTSPSMRGSIGSAASAGCIRMLNEHIIELYDMVNVGTPVIAVA